MENKTENKTKKLLNILRFLFVLNFICIEVIKNLLYFDKKNLEYTLAKKYFYFKFYK